MFLIFDTQRTRPTRDIDFLGKNMSNDPENIHKIIRDILRIESEDGVSFISESINVKRIAEETEHHGLHIRFTVTMDTIKRPMQIDISFGDTLVPPPSWVDFPTLLNMPAPKILAYHPENIIPKKFEAIVKRHTQNSRMKDFYDVYYLTELIFIIQSHTPKKLFTFLFLILIMKFGAL